MNNDINIQPESVAPAPLAYRAAELLTYAPIARRLLHYSRVADEAGVRMIRYGQNIRQHIAYLSPSPDVPPRDVLVCFIHGGGWRSGSGWGFRSCLPLLAQNGYPCLSAGYRLAPRNMYPAQAHDVISSVETAWREAALEGIKMRGVALVGHSAGGHLSGLLAANGYVQRALGLETLGAVPISGVLDMDVALGYIGELPVMAEAFAGPRIHEADPMRCLREPLPPIMCVHGARDPIVPIEGTRRFVEAAQEYESGPVSLVELETAGHVDCMNMMYPDCPESELLLDFLNSL